MVLNRTLEILNKAIGAEYSMILLVHPDQGELFLRSWMASATVKPPKKHTGGWKSSEPLARWVVGNAQTALIPNIYEDERWPKGVSEQSRFHSVIAVPLLMGAESLGALLLFHRQVDRFTQDMSDLAQAAAKQIAVSINNTQLFNLIRDQAERLGELLRSQHVETSRSQAMLEAVADGVLVTDAQRVITLFNASAEKILKLNRSQVLGQSLENFIGLFGKAAQDWVQTIQDWSEDPISRKSGESKSAQIELDDQRVVSVHLSPVLLRKDFLGTVSIFQDITHLVELDRLKSEFVATVSHELRTPMTSIKGYVEILLMGAAGSLSETQTHFLQVVRSNTDRLATLVNDLLDISRIEAGRVTLTLQPLEPQYIIRNSLDMIIRRSTSENKPMQVNMEVPPDLPRAYGDRERLQQILDNLVQNAFQYTPEGGHITIRAQVNGDMVKFSVQDDGVGIPKEDQSRVFERFFRGENPLVLATSGTGLGLSIVKHLVEMHDGAIWFESPGAPGLGSEFSFTIPLYESGKADYPS
jgi:PAS domain S-box-containing protein